jgi:4'-phosphopantetheinyl transferase
MAEILSSVACSIALPAVGEAHVWRASLREFGVAAAEPSDASIVQPSVKEQNVRRIEAGRSILRSTLAAYLKCQPSQLLFVLGRTGKPELAHPWERSGLEFNLSHSGDWLLLAVARRSVGIDIERRVWLDDYEAVGRTCFAQEELFLLRAAHRARQRDVFYRLWTRKEAWGKATGEGLVPGAPSVTPSFPDGWSGAELASLPGYAAALVLEGEMHAVREFEFDSVGPAG